MMWGLSPSVRTLRCRWWLQLYGSWPQHFTSCRLLQIRFTMIYLLCPWMGLFFGTPTSSRSMQLFSAWTSKGLIKWGWPDHHLWPQKHPLTRAVHSRHLSGFEMGWRGGELILLFCFQYWSLVGKKMMLDIQKLHQWWKSAVHTLTDENHHNTHSIPVYFCTVCCYVVPVSNFWSPINFKSGSDCRSFQPI